MPIIDPWALAQGEREFFEYPEEEEVLTPEREGPAGITQALTDMSAWFAETLELGTSEFTLSSTDASDFGIEFAEGFEDWQIGVKPTETGFTTELIDPDGWRINDSGFYINPEGEQFTYQQVQAQQEIADLWARVQHEMAIRNPIIERLWVADPRDFQYLIEAYPESFFAHLVGLGHTDDVDNLLKSMGFTAEEIAGAFGEEVPTPWQEAIDLIPDEVKDVITIKPIRDWFGKEVVAEVVVPVIEEIGKHMELEYPDWLPHFDDFKLGLSTLLELSEQYVFAPWRMMVAETMVQLKSDIGTAEPGDVEFLNEISAMSREHGTFGHLVSKDAMLSYEKWINTKGNWGTALYWISELGNPIFWIPYGGLAAKAAIAFRPVPWLGKASAVTARGIIGAERGLAFPMQEMMRLTGRGAQSTIRRLTGNKWTLPIVKVPAAQETLGFIRANHPGRLGEGAWGKIKGFTDVETTIRSSRLISIHADEIGATWADFAVSQLDHQFIDISKALTIKNGRVVSGITGVNPGVPRIKGKPSYAWGDVFEHPNAYRFADPRTKGWIDSAHIFIDDLVKYAGEFGIEFEKKFFDELSHYFPRGGVTGLKGVTETNFIRVGAGLPGSKIPAMRHRVFEFMEDGLALGYKYGTPKESLQALIHGTYRLIGNKQALDIIKESPLQLVKPLAKETDWGVKVILEAELARKAAQSAEKLQLVLQRIRRGETPHASTMRWMGEKYPELIRRIENLTKLTGAEREAGFTGLITEARVITADAKLYAVEAVQRRVTAMEAASHRGFTEGLVDIPGLRNRIFQDVTVNGKRITGKEVALRIDKAFRERGPRWLEIPAEVNRGMVTLQAALDTSAPFIQGIPTLGVDVFNWLRLKPSMIWGKSAAAHIRCMVDKQYLKSWRAAHLDTYLKYGNRGLITASDLSDFYKGLGFINKTVGKISIVGKIPREAYGRTGHGFAAWGEMARVQIIESMERIWLRGGGSRAELVDFANMMTGVVSSKAMGVSATQRAIESLTLFAPRYTRANLMFMRALLRGGMTGKMARTVFGGMVAGWVLSYCAISAAMGQEPKLNPAPKSYGGDGAEFMSVEIGGQNIGMPGFFYSFIKMFAGLLTIAMEEPHRLIRLDYEELMKNHPELRWLLYKTSPLVSTAYEMREGRDVLGNRFEDTGDYMEGIYENFLSIALQSIITQDPPASPMAFGAEVLGLRTFPEGAWDKFYDRADELISELPTSELTEAQIQKRAEGTLGWRDLEELQKLDILDKYPELQELWDAGITTSERRETDMWRNWRTENDRLNSERDTAEQSILNDFRDPNQDYSIVWLRDQLGEVAGDNWVKRDELERRFPEVYEEFEKNRTEGAEDLPLFDQAYNEWYDWVLYGPGTHDDRGDVIWSVVEQRRKEWMEKWGEEYYDYIIEVRKYGFADKDDLLFKIWEDKQELWHYWQITDDQGNPDANARMEFRQQDENLDTEARLIFLGYVTTIQNPEAEEVVREWCEEFNVDIRNIPAFSRWMISEVDMEKYGITDPDIFKNYSELPTGGYDREWFLQENPELYRYWVEALDHQEINFEKMPTRDEFPMWEEYWNIPSEGNDRKLYRWNNPKADAMLVRTKGYTPIRDWWTPPEAAGPTPEPTPEGTLEAEPTPGEVPEQPSFPTPPPRPTIVYPEAEAEPTLPGEIPLEEGEFTADPEKVDILMNTYGFLGVDAEMILAFSQYVLEDFLWEGEQIKTQDDIMRIVEQASSEFAPDELIDELQGRLQAAQQLSRERKTGRRPRIDELVADYGFDEGQARQALNFGLYRNLEMEWDGITIKSEEDIMRIVEQGISKFSANEIIEQLQNIVTDAMKKRQAGATLEKVEDIIVTEKLTTGQSEKLRDIASFLIESEVDLGAYVGSTTEDRYVCHHFAVDLAKEGAIENIRIDYCRISSVDGTICHAINEFSVDGATFYIEPQSDQIMTTEQLEHKYRHWGGLSEITAIPEHYDNARALAVELEGKTSIWDDIWTVLIPIPIPVPLRKTIIEKITGWIKGWFS